MFKILIESSILISKKSLLLEGFTKIVWKYKYGSICYTHIQIMT